MLLLRILCICFRNIAFNLFPSHLRPRLVINLLQQSRTQWLASASSIITNIMEARDFTTVSFPYVAVPQATARTTSKVYAQSADTYCLDDRKLDNLRDQQIAIELSTPLIQDPLFAKTSTDLNNVYVKPIAEAEISHQVIPTFTEIPTTNDSPEFRNLYIVYIIAVLLFLVAILYNLEYNTTPFIPPSAVSSLPAPSKMAFFTLKDRFLRRFNMWTDRIWALFIFYILVSILFLLIYFPLIINIIIIIIFLFVVLSFISALIFDPKKHPHSHDVKPVKLADVITITQIK